MAIDDTVSPTLGSDPLHEMPDLAKLVREWFGEWPRRAGL